MVVVPTLPINYTVPRNVSRSYKYFERVVVPENVDTVGSIDRPEGKSQFHAFSLEIIQHGQVRAR